MADFGISEMILLASVAVSAASAGVGAAMSASAANEQADAQKKAARAQADAERAAGEARRQQIEYDAERARKSLLSRQAAAGVQVSTGSLLENEMRFASEAEYAAQLAQYPHQVAGQHYDYQSSLFGSRSANAYVGTTLATIGAGTNAYRQNPKAINTAAEKAWNGLSSGPSASTYGYM